MKLYFGYIFKTAQNDQSCDEGINPPFHGSLRDQ